MEHILRIDVDRQESRRDTVSEEDRFLGGRGLSAAILNREVDPLCHPLGGGNKLIIAPGLLDGTMAPSFRRISFGAKSPLTYGIKEANAGGTAAQKLDRLGIKCIVVEGKPKTGGTSILRITKEGCEFSDRADLAGKQEANSYESIKFLAEAMDKAGSATDSDKIAHVFRTTSFHGPRGEIKFDDIGQALAKDYPIVVKDGQVVMAE